MESTIVQRIKNLDWSFHTNSLHEKGYAVLPKILSDSECDNLAGQYSQNELYRSTINMKRYQFGSGEYKYFKYPLPAVIDEIRQSMYPYLANVANDWMLKLGIHKAFPNYLGELLEQCHQIGQHRPTPLILNYHTIQAIGMPCIRIYTEKFISLFRWSFFSHKPKLIIQAENS